MVFICVCTLWSTLLVRVTVTRSKGTVILKNPTGDCKRESLCVLVVRVQLQGAYSPSRPCGEHPGAVLVAVLLLFRLWTALLSEAVQTIKHPGLQLQQCISESRSSIMHRRSTVQHFLALLLASTISLSAAYPELFVESGLANGCTDIPTSGLGAHGDPALDRYWCCVVVPHGGCVE
jgi:hypothetical protein